MDSGVHRYRSKVDRKITLIIWGTVILSFATLFLIPESAGQVRPMVLILVTAIWLIALPFMWPVDYTITDGAMVVRIGVIKLPFPIETIENVHSESGLLIKPVIGIKAAYSVDRLFIETERQSKKFFVVISPVDKDAFLRDLQERDPDLVRDGSSLQRRAERIA